VTNTNNVFEKRLKIVSSESRAKFNGSWFAQRQCLCQYPS